MPRVSVGLPVHNGEAYLAEAIEAILGQSFADLELIVSDNASSDTTEEIVRGFEAADERISFQRHERNLGAAPNFNLTFQRASGEYFAWAAHDDVLEPEFLARCVEALDADPGAVIACTGVRFIDADGATLGDYRPATSRLDSENPVERFADLILNDHLCLEVFGLMRAEALRRTSLLGGYVNSDRVLLAELGLRGRFLRVPEPLFLSRDHPERSVRATPFHLRGPWYDSLNAGRRSFPHLRTVAEYRRAVRTTPLSAVQRRRCLWQLARWPTVNMNWARALSDLVIGLDPRLAALLLRLKRRFYRGDRGWDAL